MGKRGSQSGSVNVYDVITDKIIDLLNSGEIPWKKPWSGFGNAPQSLVSGKPYRGVNSLLLGSASYESPYWLTYNQAQDRGGNVQKGEKGWPCIYWNWQKFEDEESGKVKKVPFLKKYTVFNVCQTDGIAYPEPEVFDFEPLTLCEKVLSEMPDAPPVRIGSKAAYYPVSDLIEMPKSELFEENEEYYSALFHELTHSTGHSSRLNRPGIVDNIHFGTEKYSKEELVAEMGAAYLCGHTGIETATIQNSASYIQGWLSRLQDDKKLVVQAAGQAQKSTDYILGRKYEDSEKGIDLVSA